MNFYLFDSWASLLRVVISGVGAYICLIFFLRIAGKRVLAKMNAFDLVVTVSLGSTLATIALSQDVTLAQGLLALALLIGLQFAITWSSIRVPWLRTFITGEPALLLYHGKFIDDTLLRERITEAEVHAAVRAAGILALDAVEAVVLETDGSISVVRRGEETQFSSLGRIKTPGLPI